MKKILFILLTCVIFISFDANAQTCGTTNIALNRPVTVSAEQEYHYGDDAVDGNFSTGWYVSSDDSHISVDLGQSYNICKVKIYWTSNGRGKNYKIQVSTDNENWTDIFTRTNNSSNTDDITLTGSGRYVRVLTSARVNAWSSLEMNELQIYNSLAGNQKPSVSLTAPSNNATFFSETNITLTANASDIDGNVTRVEFYEGSNKIGEDLTAPYSFVWSNVEAGTYSLRAKAYDDTNADSLSTAINITVNQTNRWSLQGNANTAPDTSFLGTTDEKRLVFKTNSVERMTILADGFVGIGTETKPHSEAKFGVNGAIYAKKLKVTQTGWADFVFNKDYKLPTLKEVEQYIKLHKHLPGVPTTAEVEKNGTDVAEIQATLLKKIEELTLYMIEQNKKIEAQRKEIEMLKKNVNVKK